MTVGRNPYHESAAGKIRLLTSAIRRSNVSTIVWLHNDLRLADNPALYFAADRHDTVIPIFIWSPVEYGDWLPGGARRWWLHHSLDALRESLEDLGSQLVLRTGDSLDTLQELIDATGAEAVYWNTRYEPALVKRDRNVEKALTDGGIECATFEGTVLHDPDKVKTGSGGPYHVFTPFWKKFQDVVDPRPPLEKPPLDADQAPSTWPESVDLDDLGLLPQVDWAGGIRDSWTPGEQAAHERLQWFLEEALDGYSETRNLPHVDGTSRLSPHLCHGEITPRQVWFIVREHARDASIEKEAEEFLREIAWREFSYHLLHHYPETTTEPLREKYAGFKWLDDPDGLKRWQEGKTGYPIVDAGMRQLWHIGWMHNRVRMIVASFLTKDLLVHWREGADWFWDTLVDADLANNTMGWQWAAGSGADAQPFFRIFNPVSQGERYDPDGVYVREWVPELSKLPDRYIHKPWEASESTLEKAGVVLGETYPEPIVDHKAARERALGTYQKLRG
jgi:deoxyribodipyrimidine photo-lyase